MLVRWIKLSCLYWFIIQESLHNLKNEYADELPHILNDEDYLLKYKSDLRSAVFWAKASPHALFKGYNICIAANVQTPAETLSAIVRSAGGNVSSMA